MHYYQFNIGDYASHTAHLEPLEDLAYRRMIDWCYLHEKALPQDVVAISKLIRLRGECTCIANVLQEFFLLTEDGYVQPRINEVIESYKDLGNKRSKAAKRRWANERKRSKGDASALQEQSKSNANQEPLTKNQKPLTKNQSITPTPESKIPPCPVEQIIQAYRENAPSLVQPRLVPSAVKSLIASRWRQSEKHRTLDFWKAFFAHCEASDFLAGRTEGRGQKPFRVDLGWTVKESNFAKIINGNYDNA